jgi:hypothetical protein
MNGNKAFDSSTVLQESDANALCKGKGNQSEKRTINLNLIRFKKILVELSTRERERERESGVIEGQKTNMCLDKQKRAIVQVDSSESMIGKVI